MPEVIIKRDYEGTFESRVRKAIKLNEENDIENVDTIVINSGSYRSYCMKYDRSEEGQCKLDFYAANRRFGFEHTIEDIAKVIARDLDGPKRYGL